MGCPHRKPSVGFFQVVGQPPNLNSAAVEAVKQAGEVAGKLSLEASAKAPAKPTYQWFRKPAPGSLYEKACRMDHG